MPLWYVYGNHGLEPARQERAMRIRTPAAWVAQNRAPHLPSDLGVRIEDKGLLLTLHFRGVRRSGPSASRRSRRPLRRCPTSPSSVATRRSTCFRAARGNKGVALAQARDIFACHHAIYVGDEDTDEAAFAVGGERTLAIRVEPSEQLAGDVPPRIAARHRYAAPDTTGSAATSARSRLSRPPAGGATRAGRG